VSPKVSFLPVLLVIAACSQQPAAPVTDAVVRLPAATGRPGAAYFTLHGGETGRTLASVSSPSAGRTEMHDMTMSDGMMTMTPLTNGVAIPAKGQVRFESGGKHVMLFDMKPGLKAGDAVQLRFTFTNGETASVSAKAEAPGGGDMHGGH